MQIWTCCRWRAFGALLAHALIVDDIFGPLNVAAFGGLGLGPETESRRPRLRSGEGQTAAVLRRGIERVGRHGFSVSGRVRRHVMCDDVVWQTWSARSKQQWPREGRRISDKSDSDVQQPKTNQGAVSG